MQEMVALSAVLAICLTFSVSAETVNFDDLKSGAPPQNRLAVKSGGRVLFLKIEDIDWVEAADNYVNLHIGNEAHLHRETMAAFVSSLNQCTF